MELFLDWLRKNVSKVVAIPLAINSVEFLMLFLKSIQDGIIDDKELMALMQLGDSLTLIFLTLAMALLKLRKKDNRR